MLGVVLHAPRGPFYSPKGPRSRWSSIWQGMVAFYPRVHQTVRCTPDREQCNDNESLDWLLSASGAPDCSVGGTRLPDAPFDRWLEADVTTSRWLVGTPDCPAHRADGSVNYSRQRLKIPRAGCSVDHALDYLVGGTGPFGATQSSPLSHF
jgi:hypothetical protein